MRHNNQRQTLAKQDREDIRLTEAKLPDRESIVQTAETTEGEDQPVNAERDQFSVGALPEDMAFRSLKDRFPGKRSVDNEQLEETSVSVVFGERKSAREENAAELSPTNAQSMLALTSEGKHHWPEDRGRVSLPDSSLWQSRTETIPDAGLTAQSLSFVASLEAPVSMPLPPPRQIVADEIARHKLSSLRRSDLNAGKKTASPRSRLLRAYRVKVRAHLAAHRPNGGFGEGLVIVGFSLSGSGKVMSAHVVRSSGRHVLYV